MQYTNKSKTPQHEDPLYVPTQLEWEQMTESEKVERETNIISALEREFNLMGETTIHFEARASATEVLRRYYGNQEKKVFIASDLHTLYPGEQAFYPDLLVVFDVDDHHRRSWNVLREKKGLDFALEILSKATRRNDQVKKLNLFARLGIPEYFLFDPDNYTIRGYHLTQHAHKKHQAYEDIKADTSKRVFSRMLGLHLTIEDYKLRFVVSEGLEIPFGDELINRLNHKLINKDHIIADSLCQIEDERKQKEEQEARADKLEEEVEKLRLLLAQKNE